MERARELIKPYVGMPGMVGMYVVGSSTRPYRDPLSDYDIEIVVEDEAYEALPNEQRHVFVIDEGPPRRVDHEFYLRPWSEFAALVDSPLDLFHFAYRSAVILHDPSGRIADVVKRLAALPDRARRDRMRVHYLEFIFSIGRATKTLGRGNDLNARLVLWDGVMALFKLLFVQRASWVPNRHWMEQELRLLGVDEGLLEDARKALLAPDAGRLRPLAERVNAYLNDRGETFHRDSKALMAWAYLTTEGREAFALWGGR